MVGNTQSGIRFRRREPAAAAADLCRPGTEADALERWGLAAMASAGDVAEPRERLEAAAGVYRGHGAGAAWLERLRRDALHARGRCAMSVGVGVTPFRTDADATIRLAVRAEELGYARFGSAAEGLTQDAVVLLTQIAGRSARIELATAVLPVWSRTPARGGDGDEAAAGLQRAFSAAASRSASAPAARRSSRDSTGSASTGRWSRCARRSSGSVRALLDGRPAAARARGRQAAAARGAARTAGDPAHRGGPGAGVDPPGRRAGRSLAALPAGPARGWPTAGSSWRRARRCGAEHERGVAASAARDRPGRGGRARQIAAAWLLAYLTRMGPIYPRTLRKRFGFAAEIDALLEGQRGRGDAHPARGRRAARSRGGDPHGHLRRGARRRSAPGSRQGPTRSTWCCPLGLPEERLRRDARGRGACPPASLAGRLRDQPAQAELLRIGEFPAWIASSGGGPSISSTTSGASPASTAARSAAASARLTVISISYVPADPARMAAASPGRFGYRHVIARVQSPTDARSD